MLGGAKVGLQLYVKHRIYSFLKRDFIIYFSQADTQSTEPHQPGPEFIRVILFINYFISFHINCKPTFAPSYISTFVMFISEYMLRMYILVDWLVCSQKV